MGVTASRNVLGPSVSAEFRKTYVDRLTQRLSPLESVRQSRTTNVHRMASHLVDVARGHGWRSRSVNRELRDQHINNRRSLAEFDPESLRIYVGLMSGLPYHHQARLTSTVFQMNRDLSRLVDAGRQLADLRIASAANTRHGYSSA